MHLKFTPSSLEMTLLEWEYCLSDSKLHGVLVYFSTGVITLGTGGEMISNAFTGRARGGFTTTSGTSTVALVSG